MRCDAHNMNPAFQDALDDLSTLFTSIGVVPQRSLRSLRLRTSFVNGAVQKERAEIDLSEIDFSFHEQVHDSVLKNIAVS